MSPVKAQNQDIFVTIIDPCLMTKLDSDNAFKVPLLDVPIGQSEKIYKLQAPSDRVSLFYGTGFDKCGSRIISLSH